MFAAGAEGEPVHPKGRLGEIPVVFIYIAMFAGLLIAFAGTGIISHAYHERVQDRAAFLFETGQRLAAQGKNDEAVKHYHAALAINRENNQYRLALSIALINLKRLSEADTYLKDVLQRDPTNGIANLMAARVAVQQQEPEVAISYYQRAIYGLWQADPGGNRLRTRLELIDYLHRLSRRSQEVAELMQLEAELPDDNNLRLEVAGLYMSADNPERAAALYRQVLAQSKRGSVEASLGLARALVEQSDYSNAQDTLRRAVFVHPDNAEVRRLLDLCDSVLALDPTERRIGTLERRRRSKALLDRVLNLWKPCRDNPEADLQPHTGEYLKSAEDRLKIPLRRMDDAAVETNMALSEKLWDDYQPACGAPDQKSPLALAMKKLEQ